MGIGTEKFQSKLSPGGSLREVSFQKDWPAIHIKIHTGPAKGKSRPVLAAQLEFRMKALYGSASGRSCLLPETFLLENPSERSCPASPCLL